MKRAHFSSVPSVPSVPSAPMRASVPLPPRRPLELVVMSSKFTREKIRTLLDQYAEGALPADEQDAVKEALEHDSELRDEYQALSKTIAFMRQAPKPAPPTDMVARVRAQLSAEKSAALEAAAAHPLAMAPSVTEQAEGAPSVAAQDNLVALPRRHWWREAAIGLAAAAAIMVGIASTTGGSGDTQAAGFAGQSVGEANLVVTGVSAARLFALAADHGLTSDSPAGLVFTGSERDAARFHLALLREVASKGGDVEGVVGQGDVIEVRISLRP